MLMNIKKTRKLPIHMIMSKIKADVRNVKPVKNETHKKNAGPMMPPLGMSMPPSTGDSGVARTL